MSTTKSTFIERQDLEHRLTGKEWPLTRQRTAYLLRAARSRSKGNAVRLFNGCAYRLSDCDTTLTRI